MVLVSRFSDYLIFKLANSALDAFHLAHHHAHHLVHRLLRKSKSDGHIGIRMALNIFEFPYCLFFETDLVVKIELWKSKEGAPADNQKCEQVEPRAWVVGHGCYLQHFSVEHK